MTRTRTLIALAAIGVLASACAPATHGITAANNPSLNSVHQPVVERADYVLDLATSGDSVPAGELARLDAWFATLGVRYGDRITIDTPSGIPAYGARRDVGRVAGAYGLLLSDGAPITTGEVQPGTIRVVASRAVAHVPGCPAWAETGAAPSTNTTSNFGCGVNSNIAAMVADPNDLVLGQPGTPASSASTASRAVRVYRERQPTASQPLPTNSTTRGN